MEIQKQNGFVVLTAVLVSGAIASAIAMSLIMLSIMSTQSSFSSEQSYKALGLADYCAETALRQMYANPNFSSAGTVVTVGSDSCTYSVTVGVGEARTVVTKGIVGAVSRRIQVDVNDILPQITYSGWRELP